MLDLTISGEAAMSATALAVSHHMILVKNVAYLSVSAVEFTDRMRQVLSNAVAHISFSGGVNEAQARLMLRNAVEVELGQPRIEHPSFAQALRCAREMLAGELIPA
ncbi:hypothetical protein CEJ45_22215 [Herbaspirillum aquaticum]|uniref:Uncharacterized protein n=2 Tax=Herbaspirillum aquaticum TaxID=568783 RepID=A0A225SMB7_9BURK|nr:hypothetical protein CEJ45_22215 [Herbaspirillum aquaticum]